MRWSERGSEDDRFHAAAGFIHLNPRIGSLIGSIPRPTIIRIGWATGSFGLIQLLRFANNVILARLLSPPLFGLMMIVNSIRTGVELISDVGIKQNIVKNEAGHTPDFYDTAWTLKVLRGVALGALFFLTSNLFASFFEQPQLAVIMPVIAITFVFLGFQSTSSALLQKRKTIGVSTSAEVIVATISLMVHVSLALITPTIWALVLGSVFTSVAALIASYLTIPGTRHRFMINREAAREIFVFGKWIFLSSIIYFAAMNFDRLYFAKLISLTELGIYSIARSLSDMLSNLVIRTTNMVLFPSVAAMRTTAPELRARLLHARRMVLALIAVGLGCFVATSDAVVNLLYDQRYETAGVILPVLLLGVWLAILSVVNDSILLGMGKPAYTTTANGMKLATIVVGVPIAFHYAGLIGAVVAVNVGEGVRYVTLWWFGRRAHLGFGRDDLALTILFLITIPFVREVLSLLGLTGDIASLFPIAGLG
ncbi:MAG TPA: oligosaccharide flippase family protein [Sphingomicrobium sp.]|nr:oligosaccharide flippase family protein [Sphingomicrobium sp.]